MKKCKTCLGEGEVDQIVDHDEDGNAVWYEVKCLECDGRGYIPEPNSQYNYVDCVGSGCEGWLNLFFGDYCVNLVNDPVIADEIRKVTPKRIIKSA